MTTLQDAVSRLKTEKNAMILAHLYQDLAVQSVADVVGDSFEMARQAALSPADLLIVCGVTFMAESAKILSPDKTVLLPRYDAGCIMADMITPSDVLALRAQYPNAAVMCYVNTSAAVKAVCDVCCTSSSAVKIAKKLDADTIIFVPDRNLGGYVAAQVPEKQFVFFDGCCPIHDDVPLERVHAIRARYPDACLLAHPECKPEVAAAADYVGSTSQMINRVLEGKEQTYIVGTEVTIAELLRERAPEKTIYALSPMMVCSNMRKTTVEDVLHALENEVHLICLSEEEMTGAKASLEKMIELGK
ncbi:MAG: quinolinate synthase NadA [Oscillospiraceae bacterium]|nr:quinolinate synthase NadA [Oscillospiraceae bacterium]